MDCATCGDKECIFPSDYILICRKCLLSTRNQNLYIKLLSIVFYLKDNEFISSKLKMLDNKLFFLLKRLRFTSLKKYVVPFTFIDEYFDRMEENIRSYYFSSRCRHISHDEETNRYFKRKYKTVVAYEREKGLYTTKHNWKDKLRNISSRYGDDLTIQNIRNENPSLFNYIKNNLTFREAAKLAKVEIKFRSNVWTLEKINKNAMDLFKRIIKDGQIDLGSKTRLNSMGDYRKFFGPGFIKAVKDHYHEDKKIKFPEIIRRNHNRKKLREDGIKVEEHEKLVREVINKRFRFCHRNPDLYDEALLAGTEGLIIAAGLYNPDNGAWSTYAWNWIEGKISRHFENNNPDSLIRVPCHQQKNKELVLSMRTLSLEKKIDSGDGKTGEFADTIKDETSQDDILVKDIFDSVSRKFGEEVANNFVQFFLHGKKWKKKGKILEEVKIYVKDTFYG